MAEKTGIAWTRSTFNPWIGCTKIGPGCDHCYAEALDKRMQYGKAVHWGAGVPRYRTGASNWAEPLKWNLAQTMALNSWRAGDVPEPQPWSVFCASLADVFDNEAPFGGRRDLWGLIHATPNLSWLLVTKRIGNVHGMVPESWLDDGFPPNVRLLITVCNQEEADRDIPKLLALPCKNGISYEPALGPVDWTRISLGKSPMRVSNSGDQQFREVEFEVNALKGAKSLNWRALEWLIVGGESTQGAGRARPFVHGWARDTIRQCRAARVPVFIKQMGSNATNREGVVHPYKDRAGTDPAEWPEDLRVQEFPA